MSGGAEDKKGKRQPLRSSIACQRCRKSKIKCHNTGADAPCDTCIKSGKECVYPDATPIQPKRPDPPAVKAEERAERKRLKKLEEAARHGDSQLTATFLAEEVLSAPFLSETMWSQIFDIYRMHYATELPFLHLATLKEKMGARAKKTRETSSEINLVLLGILTLTARFHTTLVSYVANTRPLHLITNRPRIGTVPPEPASASEYYAEALTKALGGLRAGMTLASVERVQAFLMLGLYEWSQSQPGVGGLGAWMYIGVAIRMAQALGLGFGDKPGKEKSTIKRSSKASATPMSPAELMISKEIRRRTMFSCLILDRMLGCGKGRVSTIRSEDLHIQLPCTDVAFDLSEDVYTGFLKPDLDDSPSRPVNNDSVLGRFVRLVDLWGEISRWSFAGGRFSERLPPWDPDSTFFKLRQKLESFYSELPEVFRWSTGNFHKHENHQASGVYVSLHMLGGLCSIMLHREYIPFIPIRCQKPCGPLDEPTFTPGAEPPGFWEQSTEELFRGAKQIVDLIDICRDKLPMSALVLFAVWTASFVGIVAVHFPHMDTKRSMLPSEDEEEEQEYAAGETEASRYGPTGLAFKTLNQMSNWLKMAGMYVKYFREMDSYYDQIKRDYKAHLAQGRPEGDRRLSVRHGGQGGGLDEWKRESSKIVDNGMIMGVPDDERHHYDSPYHPGSRDSTMERSSSVGHESYRTERVPTPRSTPSASFTAINSGVHRGQQPPEPRYDGLPGPAEQQPINSGWRSFHNAQFVPPPQPQPNQVLNQDHGPMQDAGQAQDQFMPHPPVLQGSVYAGTSADLPEDFTFDKFGLYLSYYENTRIGDMRGGVGMIASNEEDTAFVSEGNNFWGNPFDAGYAPEMQSVPGY